MKPIIQLLRPQQWLKNTFIFLPAFFDRHLFESGSLVPCIFMFVAYCLAASGIYCFNDIWDVEADRMHPTKKNRPIACGALGKVMGYLLMSLCIISSLVITYITGCKETVAVIVLYVVMNIAYCVCLKRIAIVDVFVIAIGFVLRIFAGSFASGTRITHWIVLMTFLLALFLAFSKRRDDVVMYESSGVKTRRNVNRYNLSFMNTAIAIIASITMMCYIMYTVSPEVIKRFQSPYIYMTSVFVLAGIIRYLQLAIVDVRSGSPTKVLMTDRFVQLCIIGWIATFVVILYITP